jgi:hypothetical protein
MSNNNIQQIIEIYPEGTFLVADGFDDAIIGVDEENFRVVYDIDKVITILMRDDMSMDEAYEFYYYNIVGSYVGDNTPIFIRTL